MGTEAITIPRKHDKPGIHWVTPQSPLGTVFKFNRAHVNDRRLANREVDTHILSLHCLCHCASLTGCPARCNDSDSLHSIFSASPSLSLSPIVTRCFALLSAAPTPGPAWEEPPKSLMADPRPVPPKWRAWRLSAAEKSEIAEKVEEYANGLTDLSEEDRATKQEEMQALLEMEAKIAKAQRSVERKKLAEEAAQPPASNSGAASSGGVTPPPSGGGITPPPSPAAGGTRQIHVMNAGYYQAVQNDIDAISRVFGPGFAAEKPVPIAAVAQACCGGVQEPYSQDAAQRAIASQGTYIAAVNLLWLDMFSPAASPSIPLTRQSVIDLSAFLFEKGPTFITRRRAS